MEQNTNILETELAQQDNLHVLADAALNMAAFSANVGHQTEELSLSDLDLNEHMYAYGSTFQRVNVIVFIDLMR